MSWTFPQTPLPPLLSLLPKPLQVLEIEVRDAHLTGRVEVGYVRVPLYELPADGTLAGKWWKLQSVAGRTDEGGEVLLDISYKVGKSVGGQCRDQVWEAAKPVGGRAGGAGHEGTRDAEQCRHCFQASTPTSRLFYKGRSSHSLLNTLMPRLNYLKHAESLFGVTDWSLLLSMLSFAAFQGCRQRLREPQLP